MRAKKYIITKSLRFTQAEWDHVASKIVGRKWSAAGRALLLDVVTVLPPPTVPSRRRMSEAEARLTTIEAGIENNLNQLAKAVHIAGLEGERIEVLATLVEIQRQLKGGA